MSLIADENFREAIVQGLLRACPSLDLVRLRDLRLEACDDVSLLAFAAENRRIVLTHDRDALPAQALAANLPTPGVIVISTSLPVGKAVEGILAIVQGRVEFRSDSGKVLFVP